MLLPKILKNKNLKFLFITLFGIQCRFKNCTCFFLALIVFDFYSFEIYKKRYPKNMSHIFLKKYFKNHMMCKFHQDRSINKKKKSPKNGLHGPLQRLSQNRLAKFYSHYIDFFSIVVNPLSLSGWHLPQGPAQCTGTILLTQRNILKP